jgi:hypothetical protein
MPIHNRTCRFKVVARYALLLLHTSSNDHVCTHSSHHTELTLCKSTVYHYNTLLCRRKAAGWDGCRERADGNTALPQRLMWQHPGHRSAAAAVYSASTGYLVLYGGRGHTHEVQATTAYTLHTEVTFWNRTATFCNALLMQFLKLIGLSNMV